MASYRQQIVDALVALLASIRVANGYATDIGRDVSSWRLIPYTQEEMENGPAADVRDTTCEVSAESSTIGNYDHLLRVQVMVIAMAGGWLLPGTSLAEFAREAIADIASVLHQDTTLGVAGVNCNVWLTGHEVSVEPGGDPAGVAMVECTVVYSTALGDV